MPASSQGLPLTVVDAAATPPISLFVVDTGITRLIDLLMSVSHLRIERTDNVRGRIERERFEGTIQEVLDQLALAHDLDWFFFNEVYYLSQGREATSRVLRLGSLSSNRAKQVLVGSGLDASALSLTVTPNGEAIVMTGPPKLIAFAEIIIESIPDQEPDREPVSRVRVRRGVTLNIEGVVDGRATDPPN